mmetsp:Transcript_26993/g.88270  ORF Transcript_26993/g.88270 Transcript_26993/m.88270 type:complete len:202 (+) Transcript_26993:3965-4570(+)
MLPDARQDIHAVDGSAREEDDGSSPVGQDQEAAEDNREDPALLPPRPELPLRHLQAVYRFRDHGRPCEMRSTSDLRRGRCGGEDQEQVRRSQSWIEAYPSEGDIQLPAQHRLQRRHGQHPGRLRPSEAAGAVLAHLRAAAPAAGLCQDQERAGALAVHPVEEYEGGVMAGHLYHNCVHMYSYSFLAWQRRGGGEVYDVKVK